MSIPNAGDDRGCRHSAHARDGRPQTDPRIFLYDLLDAVFMPAHPCVQYHEVFAWIARKDGIKKRAQAG